VASVVLVTDSSACLPPALFYHSHVRVVRIRILLPNGYLRETPEAIDEVYRVLESREPVASAPPTLAEYLCGIEDGAFEEALVLTPASEFAGMYRVATVAAGLSERLVEVVDTRTIAAGQCLVAVAALGAISAGAGATEAAEVARSAAERTQLVAALPERALMPRAEEIGGCETGQRRQGHPVVGFRDGAMTTIADSASRSDGLSVLEEAWRDSGGSQAPATVVFHGAAEHLARELCSLLGGAHEIVAFSPALALQLGVGCVGAAWTNDGQQSDFDIAKDLAG
jgi:fatty acid-binding protein DegV